MDEFLASSDLCEENGLPFAAEILRDVSASGGKAYVVVERGWEYDDCIDEPEVTGRPRWVYLDLAEAERVASEKNVRVLREHCVRNFYYSLSAVSEHSEGELSARIGEILGDPDYTFEDERHGEPTIPARATPEQARAIADLFTLKFAYVVETQIAG